MRRDCISSLFLFFLLFLNTFVYSQSIGVHFYNNLDELPYLFSNVESYYISSYDRTGGNDDGFRGTYSELYQDKNGEHVIFEEKSSGCIYNIWGTGPNKIADWGKVKFYFDGETTPRINIDSKDLFSGIKEPFLYPLAYHNFLSSGAYSLCAPFPFSKSLKITTEKKPFFYNIYYNLYKGNKITSWTKNIDYSPIMGVFKSCGYDPKAKRSDTIARKVITMSAKKREAKNNIITLLNLNHSHVIQYIKINPLYTPVIYNLNHIYIRVFYDNESEPSINVPIGPFFGSGLGETDIRGIFIGMSSSGEYYFYLPMPFKHSIRIELENIGYDSGGELFTEIGFVKNLNYKYKNIEIGYLGAKYNKARPIIDKKDYELLEYNGKGAIIGQVMTVEPIKPDIKQWWEGDMRIYIDEESKPRFHGTGHEDEYQGGWSSFWMSNTYSLPLFGLPKSLDLKNIFGQINGSVTVYRFWPGTIPFKKYIKISTEHGNENNRSANYSSLVFYYFLAKIDQ